MFEHFTPEEAVVEFAMHTVLSGVTNMDQISTVILLLINMSFNTMQ
jgi:hypothetical protein